MIFISISTVLKDGWGVAPMMYMICGSRSYSRKNIKQFIIWELQTKSINWWKIMFHLNVIKFYIKKQRFVRLWLREVFAYIYFFLFQDNDERAVNVIILQMIHELHLSPWKMKIFSLLNRSLIFSSAFKSGLIPLILRLSVNHLSSEYTHPRFSILWQRNTRNP